MFPALKSYSNSISQDYAIASIISPGISRVHADFGTLNSVLLDNPVNPSHQQQQQQQAQKPKKKRNLPGNPDPDAEVIALSPKTLLATNRFVCEICNKGFQRDQNLQLHRRGHNLPWKLKQKNSKENRKRAYVCPEPTCLHHHPSRALGDLTGIKKHYCRKHGEKKWKCEKCSKVYAVHSDWKAHSKTCGTREYRCDCGTLFSRKDSFITHRAFCDALAEESARLSAATSNSILPQNPSNVIPTLFHFNLQTLPPSPPSLLPLSDHCRRHPWNPPPRNPNPITIKQEHGLHNIDNLDNIIDPLFPYQDHTTLMLPFATTTALHAASVGLSPPPLSATALLQKAAASMGSTHVGHVGSAMAHLDTHHVGPAWRSKNDTIGGGGDDGFTRDFLGLTGGGNSGGDTGVKFPGFDFDRDFNPVMRHHDQGYGFTTETFSAWGKYC